MGVRGLHWFVSNACHDACLVVNLEEVAKSYRRQYPGSVAVLVVDAMSCLRQWYTPEFWVCGGQWREYLSNLDNFINTFTRAGIKLVFYFDGLVEQKKRDEWVKRRLKNNKEIARVFQFLKTHKQQPGRSMFLIPSGLATFTSFALKTLGQEVVHSFQEADYEVASYGLCNNCMGILGEDTDYLIYDTCHYFSINHLSLAKLETIMYSRQNLCSKLGLHLTDLPLFACLLGTDVVPEWAMERFRNQCMASYGSKNQGPDKRINMILAVANYVSALPRSYDGMIALAEMLPLESDKSILQRGIQSYLLPGQRSPWLPSDFSQSSDTPLHEDLPLCSDQEIFQVAKQQHMRGESYMVYNVLSAGEVSCSNTLEDECDGEIPGQALIYCPARQHIYSALLESVKDAHRASPVVKEWCVYPGNPLQQPELMKPKQLPGGTPSLRSLWFGVGPEVDKHRYGTFLACFNLEGIAEELQGLEAPIRALCTLLLYLVLQVDSLSLEDLNAFIAQALCLQGKSAAHLADLQLPQIDSRAVHLGSLFIRGLSVLMMANSTCGFPFKMDDLMPWHLFDGKLFQEKYQQAHRGYPLHELLEVNESWTAKFQNLMSLICKICTLRGRRIQSRQRLNTFLTERQEGGGYSQFQNPGRTWPHSYPHYHQPRGNSSGYQPPDPGYRSRHQPLRRPRYHPAPRWPR